MEVEPSPFLRKIYLAVSGRTVVDVLEHPSYMLPKGATLTRSDDEINQLLREALLEEGRQYGVQVDSFRAYHEGGGHRILDGTASSQKYLFPELNRTENLQVVSARSLWVN